MVASTKSTGSRPAGRSVDDGVDVVVVKSSPKRHGKTMAQMLAQKVAKVGGLVASPGVVVGKRRSRTRGLLDQLGDESVRRALAFDEPVTSGGRTDRIPDRA